MMLRNNVIFLQLPVFYLYVISICYSNFSFKLKHLAHTLPYIIANLILYPNFYSVSTANKIHFFKNHKLLPDLKINHALLHLETFLYIIAIYYVLKKTKQLFLENYSNTSIKSHKWLFQLTTALAIFYSIAFAKNVFKFSDFDFISENLKSILLLFELFIVIWYLLKALKHPELFSSVHSNLKLTTPLIASKKSPIKTIKVSEDLIKLTSFMESEKPFLDPSLTIKQVSDNTAIPVKELSVLINNHLNQHFFDFINTYRVEMAMAILKDPSENKLTVLEILYKVGFNSKSSFNTFFKKHTGFTPTNYRKNN